MKTKLKKYKHIKKCPFCNFEFNFVNIDERENGNLVFFYECPNCLTNYNELVKTTENYKYIETTITHRHYNYYEKEN